MKRRFFNAIAAVSLVLGLAVAVLWLRGYWRQDQASWQTSGAGYDVSSVGGRIIVFRYERTYSVGYGEGAGRIEMKVSGFQMKPQIDPASERRWQNLLRFERHKTPAGLVRISMLTFPLWVLLVPVLIAPAFWIWSRLRSRTSPTACHACGYDLRGNLGTSCPECGAASPALELKA